MSIAKISHLGFIRGLFCRVRTVHQGHWISAVSRWYRILSQVIFLIIGATSQCNHPKPIYIRQIFCKRNILVESLPTCKGLSSFAYHLKACFWLEYTKPISQLFLERTSEMHLEIAGFMQKLQTLNYNPFELCWYLLMVLVKVWWKSKTDDVKCCTWSILLLLGLYMLVSDIKNIKDYNSYFQNKTFWVIKNSYSSLK